MKKSSDSPLGSDVTVPEHIVIIPDGNRRWAKEHGLSSVEGHKKGLEMAMACARTAKNWGVKVLSVWGFSTENWGRPRPEVRYLMQVFEAYLNKKLTELYDEGVQIRHLGRKDRLPAGLCKILEKAEEVTKNNTKYVLNLCLDYGGRDEILRAVKKIIKKGLLIAQIDEKTFSGFLDTKNLPEPDLLIRTSGEFRSSGIMPWQTAYTEYYFSPVKFPDFDENELRKAILEYSRRQRRFGR